MGALFRSEPPAKDLSEDDEAAVLDPGLLREELEAWGTAQMDLGRYLLWLGMNIGDESIFPPEAPLHCRGCTRFSAIALAGYV